MFKTGVSGNAVFNAPCRLEAKAAKSVLSSVISSTLKMSPQLTVEFAIYPRHDWVDVVCVR